MELSIFFKLMWRQFVYVALVMVAPAFAQPAVSASAVGKPTASAKSSQTSAAVSPAPFEPDPNYMPPAMKARYPIQSIISMELANQALEEVKKAKKQIEEVFKRDEKTCFKTLLANRCIVEAKDRRRVSLNEIRPIQVEAERFKRHDAVVKREQALEKKQAKEAGLDGGRTPEEKRVANEEAFAKKVQDREAAQEKVIEKRARTERRRQKKAAEAAKRAKQNKNPLASVSAPAPGAAPTSVPAPEKVPVPVPAPVPVTTPAYQNSR